MGGDMPRKIRGIDEKPRPINGNLAERLADELRNSRESGQPMIEEETFAAGKRGVTVIWDAWDRLSLEERTSVILKAYELAEGHEYRETIALARGLTVPEAYAAGMLPFQIIPALRRGDAVTLEQCRQAMIKEGASTLFGADNPQLRFATEEDTEAVRKRLVQALPSSDQVWVITQEVGKVEDWAER